MLLVNELERKFLFTENGQEIKLADPATELQPEDVRDFYSAIYPILTTAKIEGPVIREDEVQYVFRTKMGTKG